MATFEVRIYPIQIEKHPNADLLELAIIGDYRAIVGRGQYANGDMVAYIPEAAVLPDWMISRLGLTGKLAGSKKNRVKAVKLRGILSQGLVYPCDKMPIHAFDDPDQPDVENYAWTICGEDVDEWNFINNTDDGDWSEFLGITKYEPPIPVHLAGEVQNLHGYTISYDIENLKKFPEVLVKGEEVVITEKLHGTWACWGWHQDCGLVVTSKGQSKAGLAFKDNEANEGNLYMKTLKATADASGRTALDRVIEDWAIGGAVYLLGEIFGGKVQDLKYGMTDAEFRLFDVYIGRPGEGRYANYKELGQIANLAGVKVVPILHVGEYDKSVVLELTDGRETVSGKQANIREGVVVRPTVERKDPIIGRVQLKSVSEKYLLRKGGSEFN